MLVAALFAASQAVAAIPVPVTTIIIDQRKACGIGRVADYERLRAERRATALRRRLEGEGRSVRVVTLLPGMTLNSEPAPITIDPRC